MFLNIRLPPWLVEVIIRVNAETQSAAAELRNDLVIMIVTLCRHERRSDKAKVT